MISWSRREFLASLATAPLTTPVRRGGRRGDPQLRVWCAQVAEGKWIPFSLDLNKRKASLRYLSSREHRVDAKRLIRVEFREESEPVTIRLACELDETYSYVRLALSLAADKDLVGTVSG